MFSWCFFFFFLTVSLLKESAYCKVGWCHVSYIFFFFLVFSVVFCMFWILQLFSVCIYNQIYTKEKRQTWKSTLFSQLIGIDLHLSHLSVALRRIWRVEGSISLQNCVFTLRKLWQIVLWIVCPKPKHYMTSETRFINRKVERWRSGGCIRRDRAEKDGTEKTRPKFDRPGKLFILHRIK